jgi:hypothetical protein
MFKFVNAHLSQFSGEGLRYALEKTDAQKRRQIQNRHKVVAKRQRK